MTDPVSVTLTIHDCSAESPEADTVWSEALLCGAGGSVVFEWDGSIGGSVPTAYAEPGLYTYEVVASQLDSNGPELSVQDWTEYRSTYLHLNRTMDEFFQPMVECEVYDYDDKGTAGDDDDEYIYLVRWYGLQDDGGKDASDGDLKLYNPEMQLVASWDVLDLTDLAATNGLTAGTTTVEHRLLVPVPAATMAESGTFRLVLHIVDDHASDYRDHRANRPSLDLNSKVPAAEGLWVWLDGLHSSRSGLNLLTKVDWTEVHTAVARIVWDLGPSDNCQLTWTYGWGLTSGPECTRDFGPYLTQSFRIPSDQQRSLQHQDATNRKIKHTRNVVITFSQPIGESFQAVVPAQTRPGSLGWDQSFPGSPFVIVINPNAVLANPYGTGSDEAKEKNLLTNIVIHELTHVLTKSVGHCEADCQTCAWHCRTLPNWVQKLQNTIPCSEPYPDFYAPWEDKHNEIDVMRKSMGYRSYP